MTASIPRRKVWLVVWTVLMFVLLVGLRPPSAYIDYDAGIWTLCARDMNRGGLLYKDIWEHKGPIICGRLGEGERQSRNNCVYVEVPPSGVPEI